MENDQAVRSGGRAMRVENGSQKALAEQEQHFHILQMPTFVSKVIKQSKTANASTLEHFT